MTPEEALFEDYLNTLEYCSRDFSRADDDEIWETLFENADIGFCTFFYVDNLHILESAGCLSSDDVQESSALRAKWMEFTSNEETRSPVSVRTSPEWGAFMDRCGTLKDRLKNRS